MAVVYDVTVEYLLTEANKSYADKQRKDFFKAVQQYGFKFDGKILEMRVPVVDDEGNVQEEEGVSFEFIPMKNVKNISVLKYEVEHLDSANLLD